MRSLSPPSSASLRAKAAGRSLRRLPRVVLCSGRFFISKYSRWEPSSGSQRTNNSCASSTTGQLVVAVRSILFKALGRVTSVSQHLVDRLFFKLNKRNTFFMAGSKKNVIRKRPGRPATGQDPVTAIRLSAEMRQAVGSWAEQQTDAPSRSEAIRRLVEIGLKAKGK